MGLRRYQRKKWEIPFAQILPWRTIEEIEKHNLQGSVKEKEELVPILPEVLIDEPVKGEMVSKEPISSLENPKQSTRLSSTLSIDFPAKIIIEMDEKLGNFSSPDKAIRYFVNRITDELIDDPSIELLEGESIYSRAKHKLLPVDLDQEEGVPVKIVRNGILLNDRIILRADVKIIE